MATIRASRIGPRSLLTAKRVWLNRWLREEEKTQRAKESGIVKDQNSYCESSVADQVPKVWSVRPGGQAEIFIVQFGQRTEKRKKRATLANTIFSVLSGGVNSISLDYYAIENNTITNLISW